MSPLRRPQSGDWTHLPSSLEHLSLESLKEPPAPSSSNGSIRRHTVTLQSQEIENKVPSRTQAAIEKVAEIVNKMGGKVRTHVQDNGGYYSLKQRGLMVDVMLDAYGYKATAEDAKQFDSLAREIFKEETGHERLDSLIGHDQNGNLWIYASEEAKQYAESQSTTPVTPSSPSHQPIRSTLKALTQIVSDEQSEGRISRAESEPAIPAVDKSKQDDGYSYAKTLRLTSEQLVYPP